MSQNKPYKSSVLNWIHEATNRPARPQRPAVRAALPMQRYASQMTQRPQPGQQLMVSDQLQRGMKSVSFSQYVQDFINDSGSYGSLYSDEHLESAYRTSYYLFSAIRRLANLMTGVEIAAEVKRGDEWERLPDTHHLNRMFEEAGDEFKWLAAVYYALYGKVVIYREKTKLGRLYEEQKQTIITRYDPRTMYGMHIIPNANWSAYVGADGEIQSFNLNVPDEAVGERSIIHRDEVIYWNDFDPRDPNEAVSMVSLAMNNAVTNAAIARWAAHYFLSGAMPLLLITTEEDASGMPDADLMRYKNMVEDSWRGLFGRFSLRSVFTDRKLNVQQAGLEADKVAAPELNREALNGVSAVFQFAPDLIVPPEGGTQDRHKHLMMAAYSDSVLPTMRRLLSAIERDLRLPEQNMRLVIAEEKMSVLDADRGERAGTEIQIFQGGIQTLGQTQDQLRIEPIEQLKDWLYINGRLQSLERTLRDDKIPNTDLLQHLASGWNDGALLLSEYRNMAFGLNTQGKDGYKYEVVPEPGGAGGGFGDAPPEEGGDTPAPEPTPPDDGQGAAPAQEPAPAQAEVTETTKPDKDENDDEPTTDENREHGNVSDKKPETDGDKSGPEPTAAAEADDIQLIPDTAFETFDSGTDLALETITTEPEYKPEDGPQAAFVSLDLADDPVIETIQKQLAPLLEGVAVEWQERDTFHCTLAYAPDVDDATLALVRKMLPNAIEPLKLAVNGLVFFDTPDGMCIALRVELDTGLQALQGAVRTAFAAHRVSLSQYSQAGSYNPHITLCYVPDGTPPPSFMCNLVAHPAAVTFGRDDYEYIHRIPCDFDWRALVGDYEEPDGTMEVADVNSHEVRERLLLDIYQRRDAIRRALRTWATAGDEPEQMPVGVAPHIHDAVKRGGGELNAVLSAALRAIDDGAFDFETQHEDNPVLEYIEEQSKAMQETPDDELAAWQKVAKRNRTKALSRFEVKTLPLAVETLVRDGLAAAPDDAAVDDLFGEAKKALADLTSVANLDADLMGEWAERMEALGEGFTDLIDLPDEDESSVEQVDSGSEI